ncbi:MAG: two-component regulator propeller domain-containing protein [Candidatus Aminicenantales bacterium]
MMSNNEFSPRPSKRARLFSLYRLAAAFVPAVMLGFVALAAQTEPAAQEIPNNFAHLSIKDGMSQGSAYTILQDRRGFIWIGTEDGLDRYDGYNFKIYRPSDDIHSLTDNTTYVLFQDSQGAIWVGTKNGLNRYDRDLDRFTRFFSDPNNLESLGHNTIRAVCESRDGTLWIGTDGGLNSFDRKTGKFTRYKGRPAARDNAGQGEIYSIVEDSAGILWLATNGGLHSFEPKTGKVTRFSHDPRDPWSLSSNQTRVVFEDRDGTLWVGTEGGGLNALDRKTGKFTHYLNVFGRPRSLSHNNVYAIFQDRSGSLYVGTYAGLNIFDFRTKDFTVIRNNPADSNSLSYDYIISFLEDKAGVLWIGNRGTGVDKFDPYQNKFRLYQRVGNDPRGLVSNSIRGFLEDASGNLWIATEDLGLDYWDRKTNTHTHIQHDPGNPAGLSSNATYTLRWDNAGKLWIATLGGGLDKYDPKTKKFIPYRHNPDDPASLSHDSVRGLCVDHSGTVWAGTEGGGLNKLVPGTQTFVHYQNDPAQPDSLSHNIARVVYEDRSGTLWVGTFGGGLNKLDREKGTFVRYRHSRTDSNSLCDDFIMVITEDAHGNLWIGTLNGLSKFDPKTGTFVCFTDKDGLPNNSAYGVLIEDADNIWVSTNRGLARFDPNAKSAKGFNVSDGLQSNEFNGGTCLKTRAGEMFFGGPNGFNGFTPARIKDNPYPPDVVITDLQIFNESVYPQQKIFGRTVLEKVITETTDLVLSYRARLISFEFAALHFSAPEDNQFAYRLEGLEKNWINSKNRRFVSYTNLAPGRYTFRVKAANDDGVWNEQGVAVRLRIVPPFWKTWWFLGLAFLAAVFSTYSIVSTRVRNVRNRTALLENKVRERTSELQEQIAVRKNAETEIERRQKYLEGILFNSPNAVVTTDRNSLITEWSPGAEKIFDWRREEVLGRNIDDIVIRPEFKEEAVRYQRAVLAGETTSTFKGVRHRKDGTPINVILAGSPLVIGGEVVGSIAVYTDVTELKRTEAELERRQKYLESVLFNSSNAIVAIDAEAKILEWSPGAEKIFGWTKDEVLGKDIDDFVVKREFREEARRRTEATLSGQRAESVESVRHRKDGTPINVFISSSPIYIGKEFAGAIFVYTDITELKKAEAAANEASRAKSEFLANMSHEIRTPMNGIFGMTELALETNLTHDQREYLEAVKASAESLMNIINDILDFSKIEAKKVELETIPFRLRDTVHAMISSVALLAEKKGLELAYNIPPDVPDRVLGDPGRLRQILTNLLSNSIKFTQKGEVVFTIEAEEQTETSVRLHCRVRDTGVGIAPDKIQMIFDPFTQADTSTTRMFGGTGLGLAITSQLVELMDGHIWVESELDKGSTFHFIMTLALQTQTEEESVPVRYEDLKDIPVLVVDDNATNRHILRDMLSHWGLKPTLADSTTAALACLNQAYDSGGPFRVIVTDLNMPGMDGFELAAEIKKRPEYGNLMIIMLSSAGFRGDSARCRELGLSAYLTKPVKQSLLLNAIMLALGPAIEKKGGAALITRHTLIQSRARYSVLLAEDNVINQKLAVRILENRGHRVSVAANGREALDALAKDRFDVVLMDVQMPVMDGFQTTTEIRRRERDTATHLPIVAMTAHAMKGDREKCLLAGMDDYVSKPLKPLDLLKTIELAVERTAKDRHATEADVK